MVDSVNFGPAKPVPGLATAGIRDVARKTKNGVDTSAPQRLSLADALTQKGPPFDAEKVATLKAAISSGAYQVDLASIADGVIRFGGHNLD